MIPAASESRYEVTYIHSESQEGSTRRAHNTWTVYWPFIEFSCPKVVGATLSEGFQVSHTGEL